jgi:sugar phosphate isomerase/epimerase
MRSAIQLYSLRSLDEPLPSVLDRVGATAFDGVEFADLGDAAPDAIAKALDEANLAAAAAHVPFDELDGDLDDVADRYRSLGCETLVVPYLDDDHFRDEAAVAETAAALEDLAKGLSVVGLSLCYHNHDHELVDAGGKTALERLIEGTDEVKFELDAGWVAAAGYDPVDFLERYGDRIPLVHVKDVAAETGAPVELGEGDLDARAVVEAAHEAGVEWLVYEHDEPEDALASLEHGAERLERLMGHAADRE